MHLRFADHDAFFHFAVVSQHQTAALVVGESANETGVGMGPASAGKASSVTAQGFGLGLARG